MNAILKMELESLEEIVIGEENIEEVKDRFKIIDLDSANWVFRKLKAIEAKKREIEALSDKEIEPYKLEISRIQEWRDIELASYDKSVNFFHFLLDEYYREQRKLDLKFKLTTPYGKVTSRKQQPKYDYDDDLIIESLKARGLKRLVEEKVVASVNKNDLKKEIEVLENVVSLHGQVVANVIYQEPLFIDTETGEIQHEEGYLYHYHARVITIDGKIIEGVTVEEREDSITIKVVE